MAIFHCYVCSPEGKSDFCIVQHSQKWLCWCSSFSSPPKWLPSLHRCFQVSTHCTAWKCVVCQSAIMAADFRPCCLVESGIPMLDCRCILQIHSNPIIPMKPVNICKYHLSSNHLTINHQVTYLVHEHSLQPSLKGNRAQVEFLSLWWALVSCFSLGYLNTLNWYSNAAIWVSENVVYPIVPNG